MHLQLRVEVRVHTQPYLTMSNSKLEDWRFTFPSSPLYITMYLQKYTPCFLSSILCTHLFLPSSLAFKFDITVCCGEMVKNLTKIFNSRNCEWESGKRGAVNVHYMF